MGQLSCPFIVDYSDSMPFEYNVFMQLTNMYYLMFEL